MKLLRDCTRADRTQAVHELPLLMHIRITEAHIPRISNHLGMKHKREKIGRVDGAGGPLSCQPLNCRPPCAYDGGDER